MISSPRPCSSHCSPVIHRPPWSWTSIRTYSPSWTSARTVNWPPGLAELVCSTAFVDSSEQIRTASAAIGQSVKALPRNAPGPRDLIRACREGPAVFPRRLRGHLPQRYLRALSQRPHPFLSLLPLRPRSVYLPLALAPPRCPAAPCRALWLIGRRKRAGHARPTACSGQIRQMGAVALNASVPGLTE